MFKESITEGPGNAEVATYVFEVAIILLVAFILGYLLRALLNSGFRTRIEELDHENAVLKAKSSMDETVDVDTSDFENKINAQKNELAQLNGKLGDCYTKRLKAEADLSKLQSEHNALRVSTSGSNDSNEEVLAQVAEEPVTVVKSNVKSVAPKELETTSSAKDDLKRIEGIGPKIEELLNNDGIYSYPQVVNASVDRIKGVLIAAGPNYAVHDPSTWAEQALLAENKDWSKLKILQDELKGGKRK